MKKILCSLVVFLFLIAIPAFAEEVKKEEMPSMGAAVSEVPAKASMEKPLGISSMGIEKKCAPMMGKIQMVATNEGGVIVLSGNKLMKYDGNLNLIKETEISAPMPGKQCPMMGKMMDPGTVAPAAPEAPAEAQEKTA